MQRAFQMALLLVGVYLGTIGVATVSVANATLSITNTSTQDEYTITEAGGCSGGCVPLGETGYIVDDVAPNIVVTAGLYRFTYLGAGDSVDDNEFSVAGGGTFCSQSFADCNGGSKTAIGSSFTMFLPAGEIPFTFTASSNVASGCTLTNSSTTNALPNSGCADYFVGVGNSIETPGLTGPASFGYISMTDLAFPGDSDFQDLGVLVSAVPEPGSIALIGVAVLGLAAVRRRRTAAAS